MLTKSELTCSDHRRLTRYALRSLALALATALAGAILAQAEEPIHAGPLFDQYQLTLGPGQRTDAAGPLFYRDEQETDRTWALPPWLSVTRLPEVDGEEIDFAYPVMTYRRYGGQYRWQLFQLLSFSGGPMQQEKARDRFTLFPLYFQQRSSDPNENYTGYGPFYGHLKNRLFRDEIYYVMFPGYSQTRKADVVTDNYFFPLYHHRRGAGLTGWQLWPLLGHEHKEITTRTNGFNEVESVPGHDKRFALWPTYFSQLAGIGTDNPERTQGIIPAFSYSRSPLRDSTTVLWPFFSHTQDRGKKYVEWDLPWPFVELARGEGKNTARFWPLYSHSSNSNLVSDFYLWPVYKFNRIHAEPLDRMRTRIAFFLYSDVSEKDTDNGASRRRVDAWPLFTWHRDLNGNRRLQVLALLEPYLPENPHIEREYAPIYSLWRSQKNAKTGASSQSLLWDLYRHERTPTSSDCSFLFGLYQQQSGPQGKRFRLFWISAPKPSRPSPAGP